MSREIFRKTKAALFVSLLAVAEAHQAQQNTRFKNAVRFFWKQGKHSTSRANLFGASSSPYNCIYTLADKFADKSFNHGQGSMDMLVDYLFERTLKVPSLSRGELDNATLGKLGGDAIHPRPNHRREETKSLDRFIDGTYGSGIYQLRVFLLAGAIYISTSPLTQLYVFINEKIVNDPKLPQFTSMSVSTCEMLVFIGWALGTVAWGPVYDQWGRRSLTYALALGSGLAFMCTAAVTYSERVALYGYAVSKFIIGLCLPCFEGSYTMIQEIVPSHRRAATTAGLNVAWSIGRALMALLCGTVTRHLNWHLETFIWSGWFTLLVFIGFPLVQESLRFLVAKANRAEAAKVAETIARVNGVDWLRLKLATSHVSKQQVMKPHRLSKRQLRLRGLICSVNWMTVSLCFFGITYAAGKISSNMYINMILFSMVDILAYFALAPILSVFGRIRTYQAALIVAATFLLLCGFLPHGSWILVTCVLVGEISVDIAFSVTYLIQAESFPTDCRITAFGCCSSIGRFMTLLAPLISRLPLRIQCMIFPSLCVFAAAVAQFLPETSGQGLDDMETSKSRDVGRDSAKA